MNIERFAVTTKPIRQFVELCADRDRALSTLECIRTEYNQARRTVDLAAEKIRKAEEEYERAEDRAMDLASELTLAERNFKRVRIAVEKAEGKAQVS
jgi:hypothetical protein